MSMPVITPGTSTREQAVTDIITSVALEQTALAHILNAEGEKIQKAVAVSKELEDLIAVNNSAMCMVGAVAELELILKDKLEIFKCEICKKHDH